MADMRRVRYHGALRGPDLAAGTRAADPSRDPAPCSPDRPPRDGRRVPTGGRGPAPPPRGDDRPRLLRGGSARPAGGRVAGRARPAGRRVRAPPAGRRADGRRGRRPRPPARRAAPPGRRARRLPPGVPRLPGAGRLGASTRAHRRRRYAVVQVHSLPDFLVVRRAPAPARRRARRSSTCTRRCRSSSGCASRRASNPLVHRLLLLQERLSIALAERRDHGQRRAGRATRGARRPAATRSRSS